MTSVTEIQQLYQQYAFLEEKPTPAGSDRKAIGEALPLVCQNIIQRSYEHPIRWYYVVFKPYDDAYKKDPAYFAVKGISSAKNIAKKPKAFIITRECDAEKIHLNLLVATSQKLMERHGSSFGNKYKLHVSEVLSQRDRQNVLAYILKESKTRTFIKYLDYITG